MRLHDIIANRIEEAVSNMFITIHSDCANQFSYSLLFNPNHRHTWFLVLISPTIVHLKSALQDGTCYLIYTHLLKAFSKDEVLRNADINTSFQTGNQPETTEAYDALFVSVSNKLDRLRQSKESGNQEVCTDCGHDFSLHQLMTLRNDESETPKEGWIMCPADNCTCFKTWSAKYAG